MSIESSWQAIRNALVEVIEGCGFEAVSWENSSASNGWRKDPAVFLSMRSVTVTGTDEGRAVEVSGDLYPQQVGHRTFYVQVKIESYKQNTANAVADLAERLRLRMNRPAAVAAMDAVNCWVADIGAANVADYTDADSRVVSVAVFDLFCSAAFEETYLDESAGYIASVDVAGDTLDDAGGVPLAEQPSFTVGD